MAFSLLFECLCSLFSHFVFWQPATQNNDSIVVNVNDSIINVLEEDELSESEFFHLSKFESVRCEIYQKIITEDSFKLGDERYFFSLGLGVQFPSAESLSQ